MPDPQSFAPMPDTKKAIAKMREDEFLIAYVSGVRAGEWIEESPDAMISFACLLSTAIDRIDGAPVALG